MVILLIIIKILLLFDLHTIITIIIVIIIIKVIFYSRLRPGINFLQKLFIFSSRIPHLNFFFLLYYSFLLYFKILLILILILLILLITRLIFLVIFLLQFLQIPTNPRLLLLLFPKFLDLFLTFEPYFSRRKFRVELVILHRSIEKTLVPLHHRLLFHAEFMRIIKIFPTPENFIHSFLPQRLLKFIIYIIIILIISIYINYILLIIIIVLLTLFQELYGLLISKFIIH